MAVMRALLLGCVLLPGALGAQDRPITKVVKLLQGMLDKSKSDGETDTELFAKYKCYCDTNTANKKAAIESNTKAIALLASEIEELQATNGKMSGEHAQLQATNGKM